VSAGRVRASAARDRVEVERRFPRGAADGCFRVMETRAMRDQLVTVKKLA